MDQTFIDRISRIRVALPERGIAALWVEPSFDFTYLTGREPLSIERMMGLLLRPDGDLRLVVPKMLADESDIDGCEKFPWTDSEGPDSALAAALDGVGRLHVSPRLPYGVVRTIASTGVEVDVDAEVLRHARARKDAAEMAALRRAGEVTDEMVEWVASLELEGVTESELGRRIMLRYMERGHRPWDELLVAAGANAAMPHYPGGDVAIDPSRPLLVDIGAAVGGYESDTTRVFFPARPDPDMEDAYEIVLAAYEAAFAAVAPGVPAEEVDRAARRVISDAGYGEFFVHRTGHGVGLEIHEDPYIRDGNAEPLEAGNCFSIEPGIYVPGRFGLRYENLVLLTEDGPEALNSTPARHRFA